MGIYTYTGFDAKGKKARGELAGFSEAEVIQKLSERGLFPLTLKEKKAQGALKLSAGQLIELIDQLEQLVRSGLPIFESLDLLLEQSEGRVYATLLHLHTEIQNGLSLFEAMQQLPQVFDTISCAFIESGSQTGQMHEALRNLKEFLQRAHALKKRVKGAMLYPAFLGGFALFALSALLIFAVPSIEELVDIESVGWLTRSVVALSHLLRSYGFVVLAGIIGAATSLYLWGGSFMVRLLCKIPPVKRLYLYVQLSRYATLASRLAEARVQLPLALQMSRSVVTDRELNGHLKEIEERINQGELLSALFQEKADYKIVPLYFARMLAVGERSANVAHALGTVGAHYTELVERRLDLFAQLLQPALLIILGFFVALIMLAILMPMTDFAILD